MRVFPRNSDEWVLAVLIILFLITAQVTAQAIFIGKQYAYRSDCVAPSSEATCPIHLAVAVQSRLCIKVKTPK